MPEPAENIVKNEFELVECYYCQRTFIFKNTEQDEQGRLCCKECFKAVYRFKEATGKVPLPVRGG